MTIRAIITFSMSCITLLSVSCTQLSSTDGRDEKVNIINGQNDTTGKLIFFRCRDRSFTMSGNYGMMVFYDERQPENLPRYELYIQKNHQVVRTTSLIAFKRQLSKIPAGETLHYYNTCAGGTHHGLDPRIIEDLRQFCIKRKIQVIEGDDRIFTICTCQ